MDLKDKDRIVNWEKIDNPGENPRWRSKVGVIEQVAWGDNPTYYGFVKEEKSNPDFSTTSLASIKKAVEESYIKQFGRPQFGFECEVTEIDIGKARRRKSARELLKDSKVVCITSAQTSDPYSSDKSSQHSEVEYPLPESDCDSW